MMIIRPIAKTDQEDFIKLVFDAGLGMTSIPKNKNKLDSLIERSISSFQKKVTSPSDEFYLFVLEDLQTAKIGGICAIAAETGKHSPLFFYRVEKREKHEDPEHMTKKIPFLRAVQYRKYWSEICSLYLDPSFRHGGVGRLLSLSRFLFIAIDPKRFSKMIFAEIRGHIQDDSSVFWEGVGKHFINTDFYTLTRLRYEGRVDLTQTLPFHPIYIELLPENVQESISKVHKNSEPAIHMLMQEGFKISNEIDICDGGPKIEAEISKIRTIKDSTLSVVAEIVPKLSTSQEFLLANQTMDFRACLASLKFESPGFVTIDANVAKALNLNIGDSLRSIKIIHP